MPHVSQRERMIMGPPWGRMGTKLIVLYMYITSDHLLECLFVLPWVYIYIYMREIWRTCGRGGAFMR